MRTLIGMALQDYRKTKGIAPVTMAKALDINLEHLAQIECGDKPSTREFEHTVLVVYPDFLTAI